jgi:putative spermidine/putrescine transport system ATP-binding protein
VADFIGKVNLIEARALTSGDGTVACEARGLGRISLPGQVPTGSVTLAVRPEKLRLSAGAPASGLISLLARVRDVAYYGDTSHVIVTGPEEMELSINVQNDSRAPSTLARGQDVWVSWSPADTLLLTE